MSSLSRAVLLVCSLGNVAALLVVVSPPGYCCSRLIVAGTQWILIKRIKGWISFCSVRLLLCDWTGCHCVPCYPHGHDESLESTRRRKTPADYFSVVWWKFFFSSREHQRPELILQLLWCRGALQLWYEPLIRFWSTPQQCCRVLCSLRTWW